MTSNVPYGKLRSHQSLDNQIWRSRLLTTTKLRLYNTCILPIFLYGSDGRAWDRSVRPVVPLNVAEHQMVPLCPKWWCSEANKATETHCDNPGGRADLPYFGDIAPGRPGITWLSTIQHDLTCHSQSHTPRSSRHAQNRSLWRLLSMSCASAMQS